MSTLAQLVHTALDRRKAPKPPHRPVNLIIPPQKEKFYRDHRELRHNSSGTQQSAATLWIQLGRYGDIINILPLLHDAYVSTGQKQNLLVAENYLSLLDGVSYVIPHSFDGNFADLHAATNSMRPKFRNFKITQVYAKNFGLQKQTDSFTKESWQRVGMLHKWNKLPLTFDRRNYQREKALRDRYFKDKPVVLVAVNGISSPFPHTNDLLQLLRSELGKNYNVIDLSSVFAERFYDLLGLFDHARCLVTIDTAHMHLARGSKVPVIALVTDGPTPWHATAPIPGQVLRYRYSEYPNHKDHIISAIKSVSGNSNFITREGQMTAKSNRRLIHIYNDYSPRIGDAAPRHNFAKSTWAAEYPNANWVPMPITLDKLPRSSRKAIKTVRDLPFVKDLIDYGVKQATDNDVIVFTNDDISFVKGLGQFLLEVSDHRAAWINRFDFRSLTKHLTTEQCRTGVFCVGSDLFAFTPYWWRTYRDKYPDMLLACEAWDMVFRELVHLTGGFEIHAMIYHQSHASFWYTGGNRLNNIGNKHNQLRAKQWLASHGKPLRELGNVLV